MIKYLGSKRRLVAHIGAAASAVGARRVLDLFTGTTRVAQELKARGAHVTAVDSARYAATLASCYVALDAATVDRAELEAALGYLDELPPRPGYVTETFCRRARYFQPRNGARIDAIRDAIATDFAGHRLEAVLLTSLLEAADRVDSTVGVQMAYLKEWAPRAWRPLELRAPALTAGPGAAIRGDACDLAERLGPFDLVYLDPPYNQHRYTANYHVWETLVAWDAPDHYGKACKRADLRDPGGRSRFNSRGAIADALAGVVAKLDTPLVVLSFNDEGWLSRDQLEDLAARRGAVRVVAVESARYVGARIGIHNPRGDRVGSVGRLRNVEYLVVCGEAPLVERAADAMLALTVQ